MALVRPSARQLADSWRSVTGCHRVLLQSLQPSWCKREMMRSMMVIASALAAPKQHSNAASRIRRAAQKRAHRGPTSGIDPLPLQGKLAIVTGGGRGIGAAVARALAQRGCRVLITYRSNVDAAADTMLSLAWRRPRRAGNAT